MSNTIKLSLNAYYGAQQFNDNFDFRFESQYWYPQSYVGLTLSRPIFTGLSKINKVKAAKTSLNTAKLQAEIARDQSRINDDRLMGELSRCERAVVNRHKNYLLYKENLTIYKIKYDEGSISLENYLSYFDDYLRAENSYLSELSAYYQKLSIVISRN